MKILEPVYASYLQGLLAGDRRLCREAVVRLLDAGTGVRELYESLFRRSMYEVGRLWETGRIPVATEHLATSITESLLTLVYPQIFAAEHADKSAVISCVANEYHQIGGRMVSDMFELNGWNGYFLGANTPADELTRMVGEKKPDLVGLSLSVYFHLPKLLEGIEAVQRVSPDIPILVGGQAFNWGEASEVRQIPGVRVITTLAVLETVLHGSAD
jgi:methanogenic corrinoid protein MtbC1